MSAPYSTRYFRPSRVTNGISGGWCALSDAGRISSSGPEAIEALAYDPQTSGGLLATVTPAMAPLLEHAGFVAIGRVVAGEPQVRLA